MNEESFVVPGDQGELKLKHWYFEGIRCTHSWGDYKDLIRHRASNNTEAIRLHFSLKGNYTFFCPQLQNRFSLKGGQHNIMYTNGLDLEVQMESLAIETFGINFPVNTFLELTQDTNDTLKRFAEKIVEGKDSILAPHWPFMDLRQQKVIQEILNCQFSNGLKRLFLRSKSIELLVLQAESIDRKGKSKELYLKSKSDRDRIVAARDFVVQNLQSPPSLKEVAKAVGVNEYKLKRGFKELFDHTVFGYLAEQRLELARKYLLDSSRTAQEIAFELGYSSPQHFNNAFKKKFGVTPNTMKSQRLP